MRAVSALATALSALIGAIGSARAGATVTAALAVLEKYAAPLGLGLALSFSQAPGSVWPVLFFALPLAGWLHGRAPTAKAAPRLGWGFWGGDLLPGRPGIG
ncbi:MAG: hypothetical protein AAF909_07460, partial [Pseudomonadota bacterium]